MPTFERGPVQDNTDLLTRAVESDMALGLRRVQARGGQPDEAKHDGVNP